MYAIMLTVRRTEGFFLLFIFRKITIFEYSKHLFVVSCLCICCIPIDIQSIQSKNELKYPRSAAQPKGTQSIISLLEHFLFSFFKKEAKIARVIAKSFFNFFQDRAYGCFIYFNLSKDVSLKPYP